MQARKSSSTVPLYWEGTRRASYWQGFHPGNCLQDALKELGREKVQGTL